MIEQDETVAKIIASHGVIKKARDLITDRGSWIKGEMAADEYGHFISPHSIAACQFCALGAIDRASGGNRDLYDFAVDMFEIFADHDSDGPYTPMADYTTIDQWNDNCATTHNDVLHGFDVVIEHLSSY